MTTPMPPAPRWPDTIQRYLNEGYLGEAPATREEVDALWQKVGGSASDAAHPNLSSDGTLQFAYQAQLQATMALLRARGLRVGSGDRCHHLRMIESIRAFATKDGHTVLAQAMSVLDVLRQDHAQSVYDPETATPDEASAALAAMRAMLPEAGAALAPLLPALPKQQSIAASTPNSQRNSPKKGRRR
jgi:hypothetical protein